MPPRRTNTSSSALARLLLPGAVLLLIAGGIGGTLWATGFFEQRATPISREGQLAFPALARPVRAYDAVHRDDLINPQTGQLNVVWIAEEQASSAMLRDLSQIIGRVVTRDKQAGFVLSERDFFPKGTRPGIAAGIPPGKRSVTVKIADIPGLELLHQGDEFDLLAVLPDRDEVDSNIEQAALLGGIKPPDTRSGQLARQTGIKPLVIGGTMVAITQGNSRSTDGAEGLVVSPSGSRKKTESTMVATIAVDPVEVAPLTEALGLELDLYCVARSGHPEDEPVVAETVSLEGLVPVVTLAQPVEAFAAITQEDLADKVTGRLNLYYFPPDQVQDSWLTGFVELNGRVPKRDLSRGAVITEADLLPVGTRPGVVGAIPAGMEAVFIDVERVAGLDRLRVGDRFEIHSRLPAGFAPSATKPMAATAAYGGRLSEADQLLQDQLTTGIRVLSRSAQVLQAADATEDGKVSIAVKHDDVRSLLQALQLEHDLFAIGRSDDGDNSDDPEASVEPQRPIAAEDEAEFDESSARGGWAGEGAPVSLVVQQSPPESQPGSTKTVTVPILIDDVPPRTRMSVDEFIEPSTGRVRYLQFSANDVPKNVVTELSEIIGRRSGRQLYAGEWVLEGDLCEVHEWSIPRDIPAGWSVIELSSLDVRGLEVARVGDQIDLVAARPIASEEILNKSRWPLSKAEEGFFRASRDDIFTQSDVMTLASQGMVVGHDTRRVKVPVSGAANSIQEDVTNLQLRETVERASRQNSDAGSSVTVEEEIWQVAVPLSALPAISEALAVQSLSVDKDDVLLGQKKLINRSRLAHIAGVLGGQQQDSKTTVYGNYEPKGDDQQGQNPQEETRDHEIAIFAVLRSGKASPPTAPAPRDIVSQWITSWGKRFSEYSKSERQQGKSVRTMQHIRGTAISEDHWLDGRPYDQFPEDAVQSRTVETLIDREQTQGER